MSAQAVEEVKNELKLLEKELGISLTDINDIQDDNEVDLGTIKSKEAQIKAAKERLAQFLADFDEEQFILKKAREENFMAQEEEAEVLRLEAKYQKMAEEAGYETIFAAGLTEAFESEQSRIRKKYADERIKEKIKNDKLYAAADEATKKR